MEITAHPLVKELTGKTVITTGLEGKFSVYHCVAAGFYNLKAGVFEFTDEYVNDPSIKNLRDKISLVTDENIKEDQVHMKVKLTNGSEITHFVEHAIGSADTPMTDEQIKEKFIDVTGEIISLAAKNELIDLVNRFEEVEDLTSFFQLCQPKETANQY